MRARIGSLFLQLLLRVCRAAGFVQFVQFLYSVCILFFRCDKQQDSRLQAVRGHSITAEVAVCQNDGCVRVTCLDRGPKLFGRDQFLRGTL